MTPKETKAQAKKALQQIAEMKRDGRWPTHVKIDTGDDIEWTVYGPPEHERLARLLSGLLEGFTEDCRRFARIAREAQFAELHTQFGLSWPDFCEQWLHYPQEVVEAIIVGVDAIGEEIPVPADLAERKGRELLHQEYGKGKAGPGRGHKTDSDTTRFGRGVDYLTARLARDRPDILERLKAGAYTSVRAAAKAAGLIKDPAPLPALQRLWSRATPDERQELADWIAQQGVTPTATTPTRRGYHPSATGTTGSQGFMEAINDHTGVYGSEMPENWSHLQTDAARAAYCLHWLGRAGRDLDATLIAVKGILAFVETHQLYTKAAQEEMDPLMKFVSHRTDDPDMPTFIQRHLGKAIAAWKALNIS